MRYIEYLEVGEPLTIKVFSKIGTVDFNTIVISSPLEDEFSVELDYNAMKLTPTEEIPMVEAVEVMNVIFGEQVFRVNTFEIAKMGVEEALSKIGGTSIPSGNYKVIINSDTMVSIISTFAGVFSGDAVQKGLSLLKGKEGEVIASDIVNLVLNIS